MFEISSQEIINSVANLFIEANYFIQEEIFKAWQEAIKQEINPFAREVLNVMIKNVFIASKEKKPICQDTGQPVVLIEQGDKVLIQGISLTDAVNEGIEKGGKEGFLRKSVTKDPLQRDNEGSYGPAVIHYRILPDSDLFKITLLPVGCGCEQMSCAAMFPPCHEEKTIKEFIINKVKEAGSKPCPPTIIGVGIGGDLEESCYLARMALIRSINERNKKYASLEESLLKEINNLNIGPQGLGGKTTALAVNIEASSCHRANLPIAIVFNCHIGRCKTVVWEKGKKKILDKDAKFKEALKNAGEQINFFQDAKKVEIPLTERELLNLKIGDKILLNGVVYTARDAAHKKLINLIQENKILPFDLNNAIIYYVGPTPPKDGEVIGSAGPTTSARMDYYTPFLLSKGIKGMIGKGCRNSNVIDMMKKHKAVYFITFAGAGALLSQYIVKSEIVAFEELGTEAIRRLELKDFPVIVGYDVNGNDLYKLKV